MQSFCRPSEKIYLAFLAGEIVFVIGIGKRFPKTCQQTGALEEKAAEGSRRDVCYFYRALLVLTILSAAKLQHPLHELPTADTSTTVTGVAA